MDSRYFANRKTLISKEHTLAQNKLELDKLVNDVIVNKKMTSNKDLISIMKNRVAIKKLEIKSIELDIKYFKDTYLKDV